MPRIPARPRTCPVCGQIVPLRGGKPGNACQKPELCSEIMHDVQRLILHMEHIGCPHDKIVDRIVQLIVNILDEPRRYAEQAPSSLLAGVYCITNNVTGETYIGSSKNIVMRWSTHKTMLRSGSHHSKALQEAWNLHGETNFSFEILGLTHEYAILESELIRSMKPLYNSSGAR